MILSVYPQEVAPALSVSPLGFAPARSVSPLEFALACRQYEAPAALLAALEKFDINKSDFVALSGYPESTVDAWFQSGGIDLNEYLGTGQKDWGMQDVLATAGYSQSEIRDWAFAHLDQPMVLAEAVFTCGASAAVVAEIVGCTADDVTSYFANAGLGDYFAYFC